MSVTEGWKSLATLLALRNPKLTFKGGESIIGIFTASCVHSMEAPLDPNDRRSPSRQIEELLVGRGVLNHKLRLAMDRKNLRTTGLLEMLDVSPCVPLEI